MTGINRRGMILQERDFHLLRELAILRVADRELIKTAAGFHSTTRANTRLAALVRAGLLRRFSLGSTGAQRKYIYALSKKGAQYGEVPFRGVRRPSDKPLVADLFIEHQLAIGEVYCLVKYRPTRFAGASFVRWQSFFDEIAHGLRLIPDGYFELKTPEGTLAAFLEVDLGHESSTVWKRKVESYVQLARSGEFASRFGQSRFRVLAIANSERRLHSLRKTTAAVTDRVFWFATLDAVKRGGLFAPNWLRPVGDELKPLVGKLL